MGNEYGETTWSVCISDTVEADDEPFTPAGTYFYIFGQDYEYSTSNDDNVKYMPGNKSLWIKTAKGKQGLRLNGKVPGFTMTNENIICDRINGWKYNKTLAYAFLIIDSVVKHFLSNTGTTIHRLPCKITTASFKRVRGELTISLTLDEAQA